jgi:hypothetical protein
MDQPIAAASGQPYGVRKAQEDAQRAIPLPVTGSRPVTPLSAPSERPGEHVMTGAPIGPGAGPDAFGIPPATPAQADVREMLLAVARQFPTPELLDLVMTMGD